MLKMPIENWLVWTNTLQWEIIFEAGEITDKWLGFYRDIKTLPQRSEHVRLGDKLNSQRGPLQAVFTWERCSKTYLVI